MAKVALVKCSDYKQERVDKAVRQALSLIGGIESFVKKGDKVLLKPNLLSASRPEKAVTTHPAVVKAMIKVVQETGGIPLVGDSPGFGSLGRIARTTGIKEVCDEMKVRLADFSTSIEVKCPEGAICRAFVIAKGVVESDLLISLPKLKTHNQTYLTGALKNQFGCIPGILKGQYHVKMPKREDFATMLIDLNKCVKPKLALMDAIIGMEGEGPSNGDPKSIGLIIAGTDLVAVDVVASKIIGLNPLSLPLTKMAVKYGLGEGRLERIEVLGEALDEVKVKDFKNVQKIVDIYNVGPLPNLIKERIRESLIPKPVFDSEKCNLCLTCIEVCPPQPKALRVEDERIVVDYKKCIRCYRCQELCPQGAIRLKTGILGRIANKLPL